MKNICSEIPELKDIVNAEKIDYGWSYDEKWCLKTSDGEKYLLRLASKEKQERKTKEHEIVKIFNTLDFEMSRVVRSGSLEDKSYILYSWVEGKDLREVISSLAEAEQFNLGLESGRILKSFHSLPVNTKHISKVNKIPKKLRQLKLYEESNIRIKGDDSIIKYVKNNINLICSTPITYRHGDFHTGNLIYTPSGNIGVIDFQRSDCGDAYEDFYKIQMFDVPLSIPFSVGYLKGYFNGEPSEGFWRINAVYVAHTSLYSMIWAMPFGKNEVEEMRDRAYRNINDFDYFREIVPKWYKENSVEWYV